MGKNELKYVKDANGDFVSVEDVMLALRNGDLVKLPNGTFRDPETGDEYWSDGALKERGWDS